MTATVVLDNRSGLRGRELDGHGPAGAPGDHPQAVLEGKRIDLEDDPVDLVGEILAVGFDVMVVSDAILNVAGKPDVGVCREPPVAKHLQGVPVGRKALSLDTPHAVAEDPEGPFCRDAGVKLTQGARGGVSRVGECTLPLLDPAFVQFTEGLLLEIHLPPDFDSLGDAVTVSGPHLQGQDADRPEILRHILAGEPVAPCGADEEDTLFIDQVDGDAVDLRLRHEVGLRLVSEQALDALIELRDLLLREGIAEAEHGGEVGDGTELLQRGGPYALGGRSGAVDVRKALLEIRKLPHELVVLEVGDLRVVELIVATIVVLDEVPEFGDSLEGLGSVHLLDELEVRSSLWRWLLRLGFAVLLMLKDALVEDMVLDADGIDDEEDDDGPFPLPCGLELFHLLLVLLPEGGKRCLIEGQYLFGDLFEGVFEHFPFPFSPGSILVPRPEKVKLKAWRSFADAKKDLSFYPRAI
jgi:hypothetical protein